MVTEVCDSCGLEGYKTRGAIINGIFGQYCQDCRNQMKRTVASGHAQWSRRRDREDNARDLIQPYDRRGNPNRDFIREYPEQSKEMFSEEELKRYG